MSHMIEVPNPLEEFDHLVEWGNAPQFIFGNLIQIAYPKLEGFWSDLYHDAMIIKDEVDALKARHEKGTLKEHNSREVVLYYYVRDMGTHLISEEVLDYQLHQVLKNMGEARESWKVTITPHDPETDRVRIKYERFA